MPSCLLYAVNFECALSTIDAPRPLITSAKKRGERVIFTVLHPTKTPPVSFNDYSQSVLNGINIICDTRPLTKSTSTTDETCALSCHPFSSSQAEVNASHPQSNTICSKTSVLPLETVDKVHPFPTPQAKVNDSHPQTSKIFNDAALLLLDTVVTVNCFNMKQAVPVKKTRLVGWTEKEVSSITLFCLGPGHSFLLSNDQ